ncbi:MAG: GntR family transcriptional regulator [Henriciella sp.]
MSLGKIEAKSLQARVYQRLRSALMSGHFEPGQILVIRDLAEQLGTSPMPIRQSLHRLVSEYALEEEDRVRSSVRVPKLSAHTFEDLRSTRRLVEGEAAALAAKKIIPDELDGLERLDAALESAILSGDAERAILANKDFHFAIYEAAGSKTLLRIIESLWLQSGPYFRALVVRYFSDNKADDDVNEHHRLLAALKEGDARTARSALHADIDKAADYFFTMSDELVTS